MPRTTSKILGCQTGRQIRLHDTASPLCRTELVMWLYRCIWQDYRDYLERLPRSSWSCALLIQFKCLSGPSSTGYLPPTSTQTSTGWPIPQRVATPVAPILSTTKKLTIGVSFLLNARKTSCARKPPTIASVGGKKCVAC